MLTNAKYETDITWGIKMLKEAFGCLKDVSGCYEKASECVHLSDPEMTNRDTVGTINSILYYTIRTKLGKNKS